MAVVLAALFAVRLVAFDSFTMRSDAMEPAVADGDWVLVRRGSPVSVGDLAAVRVGPRPGPDVLVRRVVAVDGDRVTMASLADGARSTHPVGDVVGPEVLTSPWPLDRYLLLVVAAAWLGAVVWWRSRPRPG